LSLETILFGLKFFDADPGWKKFGSGIEKSWIRDRETHPGSATIKYIFRVKIQLFMIAKSGQDPDPDQTTGAVDTFVLGSMRQKSKTRKAHKFSCL
jgi:hypothetical protein